MKKIIFLSWLYFLPLLLNGQSPQLDVSLFTREDGLSGNYITDVVKDSSGFLWIATTEGLNCYDGNRFTCFFNSRENSERANEIKDLLLLPGNRLALATDGGLFIFDTNSHEFKKLEVARNKPELAYVDNSFSCLLPGKQGRFWAGAWTGVHELDIFTGRFFKSYYADESRLFRERLSYTQGLSMAPDSSLLLLSHIDNKEEWIQVDFENNKTSSIQARFPGFVVNTTLHEIKLPAEWASPDISSNPKWMINDSPGSYWGGSAGGLYHAYLKKNVFQELAPLHNLLKKEKPENVSDVLICNNKVWLATSDQGLLFSDLTSGKAGQWKPSDHFKKVYCDKLWNLRLHQDGKIWVGCGCGYFWIDPKTMESGRIDMHLKPWAIDQEIGVVQFVDSKGLIWMGLGNGNGVVCFNPENKNCHYYLPITMGGPFPLRHPVAIAEDLHGDLWFGTQRGGGLVRWDRKKDAFSVIQPGSIPGFDGDLIEDMIADKGGNIWLAIQQIGLVHFEIEKRKFTVYGRRNGLSTAYCNQLASDRNNQIWIATQFGLQCFDPKTERFSLFLKKDGLPDNYIGSIHRLGDTLMLGFHGNFRFFKPLDLLKKKDPPPVFLTRVLVNGQEKTIRGGQHLKLLHDQNDLQFSFTALDLVEGKKAQIMYRLDRADNTWKEASEQRMVSYENMPPGDYVFEVKAAMSTGDWGKETKLLHFIILPPLWATGWFRLLMLGSLALIFWGLYSYRIRQLLKIQQVRNEISRDLHDDIGATLSNIEILSNIGQQRHADPEQAKKFLERIAIETRMANDNLHQIVWNINPANDEFSKLLARLTRYSAETLETAGIALHLDAPPRLPHLKMGLEKRRDLFLLFKEALNNIVRHAAATEVKIQIQLHGKKMDIMISDNGKGFDMDVSKYGNGLQNMQQRMKKWGGYCEISGTKGEGTVVHLSLPL